MTDPMDALTGVLSRERRLLEYLLFKLTAAQHLLATGETRFLGWSSSEVEHAAARVREAELLRAAVVARVVNVLAVANPQPSLRELVGHSPEPYRAILDDHRSALHGLMDEINAVTAANRELASGGMRLVADVVQLLEAGIDGNGHQA